MSNVIRRHALFDFGGPILLTPYELNAVAETSMGVAPGTLPLGPFDPSTDPRWVAWQAEEISEREYWDERAAAFGTDVVGYMQHFFTPAGDHLTRPESVALISEVQEAGFRAGVLTNDLSKFHGPEWREPISVLRQIDPLIDLSLSGTLKPDPQAYAHALDVMGVDADEIAFLDDQPYNVEGARAAGMRAVHFDATNVAGSLAAFRAALCAP